MPDREQNSQNDFMIEKIKTRPVNRRKLIRRMTLTVVMAVIFGTVACVTFLVLEPVISSRLYPEEELPSVEFPELPEDQEEMSPEEMLAENIPSESPSPVSPSESPLPEQLPEETPSALTEERVREILDSARPDIDNFSQMQDTVLKYIYEDKTDEDGNITKTALCRYMVTIRGVTSNVDWFDDIQESSNQVPGLIVADTGFELLILVNYSPLKNAESLVLDLDNGTYRVNAELKGVDQDTDLAIAAVIKNRLPAQYLEEDGLAVASLGSSVGSRMVGMPVIALGSPLGVSGSIGSGMITAAGTQLTGPDRSYRLLLTNIVGSRNAEGVLFNLNGQVVGIIAENNLGDGMENLITAYGITELRRIIEKLSNSEPFAYMGITGTDVPEYIHNEQGVPYGAYVTRVEMDSPAMLAGIQVGDVITSMNGSGITTFDSYCSQLIRLIEPGQAVQLTVMRQSQEEYREMKFTIEPGTL